jgi:hypothetical protein
MHAERHTIAITTAADGTATAYSPMITGRILTVRYVKPGTDPLADTVDMTMTLEATGQAVLSKTDVSASFTAAPRQATHDVDGAASLYAAGGEPVEDHICAATDRLKIVLAQGGDSKAGSIIITVG